MLVRFHARFYKRHELKEFRVEWRPDQIIFTQKKGHMINIYIIHHDPCFASTAVFLRNSAEDSALYFGF